MQGSQAAEEGSDDKKGGSKQISGSSGNEANKRNKKLKDKKNLRTKK